MAHEAVKHYFHHNLVSSSFYDSISFADYFSGSGVVAFEFFLRLISETNSLTNLKWDVDCIEIQNSYTDIWQKNLNLFQTEKLPLSISWLFKNEDVFLDREKKYDLILANPPYFSEGRGHLSSNLEKRICHFMPEEKIIDLPQLFLRSLGPGGSFYFLAPSLSLSLFWPKEIKEKKLIIIKKCGDSVILWGRKLDKE